ncbi:MAG: tRNA (adenosine(37)-N6)-threonylcarbamoyltransferase complex dimerization subunit type 1 TsaB, partial [Rhizobacter sp.]|nr:tRNA (adenosine(37)-N6)-threonylcarbamoyltransferase complex dimerization subunit type 1 TsaB [Chlorobiales bacterium]
MTLLTIECSGSPLSVAVQHEGRVALQVQSEPNRAAETIISLIDAALHELSIEVSQLHAVAITEGPGSFTSLRIGMSTAKGFCFALDKPLITIPTLPAMTEAASPYIETDFIVPLIHSKSGEFFFNLFARTSPAAPLLEHSYGTLPEIFAQVDPNQTAFIGRNLSRWPELNILRTSAA